MLFEMLAYIVSTKSDYAETDKRAGHKNPLNKVVNKLVYVY